MSNSLLIIDDNSEVCRSLKQNFEIRDFLVHVAYDSSQALAIFSNKSPDLVLLDLSLGHENGLEILQKLKSRDLICPIIMMTGFGSVEKAVLAMKYGAFDFIQKPLNFDSLFNLVNHAIKLTQLTVENQQLKQNLGAGNPLIKSQQPEVMALLEKAKKLAQTNIPILILGESGSGKELLAQFVHHHSKRNSQKFEHVNCAALSESLLDDELFGHEKGAFTTAHNKRLGLFEQAHGGSLHLDELGDMALNTQAKILRVIQNNEIRRLGGDSVIMVDIRIIASTNQDLYQLIQEKLFREDLYFRLNAAVLRVPPLRERKEDLALLAEDILRDFAFENSQRLCYLSNSALASLKEYHWPGNIRELKNILHVSATLCKNREITPNDLPHPFTQVVDIAQDFSLNTQERASIENVLLQCEHNKSKAAELLAISRKTLYNKMKKYGL
jgi:two-component system, NtrC family, response regulator AtoC